jgi:SagB-type dehydrogenase family enzyme
VPGEPANEPETTKESHAMTVPAEDATSLSLLYHLNSEPWLNYEAYEAAYEVEAKRYAAAGEGVALPPAPATPLRELLLRRSSCRNFAPRPLTLADLGAVLAGAYGVARTGELPGVPLVQLRTVPSAGGLFPLEIYAAVQAVDGLAPGLHHYNVGEHTLEPVRPDAGWDELRDVLLTYEFCAAASALLFVTAVFARSQKKYGPRGYRYILLEAGHLAQSLCLVAAERGLASLCMGGFMDTQLNRYLGLEPRSEGALYAIAVGHPQAAAGPPGAAVDL